VDLGAHVGGLAGVPVGGALQEVDRALGVAHGDRDDFAEVSDGALGDDL
jgi:hypothetical protein